MGPRRSGRLKHLPGSCVSDAPEVSDANKKRVTIDCLPDVLLLQVLASIKSGNGLEYRYRLAEDVMLDFCDKEKNHQRLLRSAIQGWLKPRASSVKTMTFKNSSADPTHSFSRDGNSLSDIFAAVSTSLTSLHVENCNDIFNQGALEDLRLLTQLTKLHITSIRQRYVSSGFDSLSNLTSLKEVKIAGDTDYENVLTISCLSALPTSLLALTQLTSLTLASQGLFEIPDGISVLSKLEVLRLDNCKAIKVIPACLRHLKSLRELSLNDTNGLFYMDSIRNLKIDRLSLRKSGVHQAGFAGLDNCSIKHLDVSHNPFASNAQDILTKYRPLGLDVLNLNSCEVDTVPSQIFALHYLKGLDLGNNGLVDLPDCLSHLQLLECLNLQGNCFPKLPQVVQKLKSLCCLSLVACNYLEIPAYDSISFFAKWHRLATIWMWKTDGVDYQDYTKAALLQLRLKLKRKRRGVSLLYEGSDVPKHPHTMQGASTSLTLSS